MASNSEIFKALADDTRLRVLNLFLVTKGSLCVCEIVDALELPQYNISKHLTVLRYVGLVDVEKEGLWGYYHLKNDEPKNRELFTFLKNYLTGKTFDTDRCNLEVRLKLREEGKCVVGTVPEQKSGKQIKKKALQAI
jgi:DNA-binding transcriptional ArsR family regulator